jgi:hypothetical protein
VQRIIFNIIAGFFLVLPPAHAGVTNGQPVNATTTNAAFMDKNTATTFTVGKTDFQNTANAAVADGSIKSEGGGYITKDWWVAGISKAAGGLQVGVLNTTLGTINLYGSTSGTVTLKPQAAAGTYSLVFPNAVTAGPVMTDGSGNLSFTSIVGVANGGTGLATLTAHSIQVGNGASSPTQLAVPASGTILTGVASSDPAFSATPTLGTNGSVAGTLGLATVAGSGQYITLVNPGALSAYSFNFPLTVGTAGYALTSSGSSSIANTWTAFPAVPITVPNGGTGATTLTSSQLLLGNGTSAIQSATAGSSGQILQSNGAGVNPSWNNYSLFNTGNAQMRIVYGYLGSASAGNCTGTCGVNQNSGDVSAVRNSAGNYTITFSPSFASPPVCVASCDITGTLASAPCGFEDPGTSTAVVVITNVAGVASDGRANFICFGPH